MTPIFEWRWTKRLIELLATRRPEPVQQAKRIAAMHVNIVLPVKIGVIAVVLYYLFYAGSLDQVTTTRRVLLQTIKGYFLVYIVCNVLANWVFILWRHFPPAIFQWLVFILGILDGLLVAGLVLITFGFASTAYWVLPGMIVMNAICIPLATPQIVLNVLLSLFYLGAGILYTQIGEGDMVLSYVPKRSVSHVVVSTNQFYPTNRFSRNPDQASRNRHQPWWDPSLPAIFIEENPAEPPLLRVFVLLLLTACCYGVQVLAERQRRAFAEEREFAVREAQLRTAGRLAAEIAHQLKNPLAIIKNTAFSLQRASRDSRPAPPGQLRMIEEEIDRADRIVTDLMDYAQLAEGHVERLDLVEEINRAIEEVLPSAADYHIELGRHYQPPFPPLFMQRRHLSGIFVNLLQNAREVLNGSGKIDITAVWRADNSVAVTIADNGPGVAADQMERIFEAYYTTKNTGTGLGLSIVKNNVELYGGSVRVESELGKGARFIVEFPANTLISLAGQRAKKS